MILSSDTFSFNEAIMFKISNDSLNCTFCNSDLQRDFSQDLGSILGKQDQDVRVIREKGPARFRILWFSLDVRH